MTPMVISTPSASYVDFQGTIYSPAVNPNSEDGAWLVAIQSIQRGTNKVWTFPCDSARISDDGLFQAKLAGTDLWYQTAWAPMSPKYTKFVPA